MYAKLNSLKCCDSTKRGHDAIPSLAAADSATNSSFAGTPIARIQVCGRQAKAPVRLIEGGMVTTALVGHIAVAKYRRHFDFYRQMQILFSYGVQLEIDIPQMKSGTA